MQAYPAYTIESIQNNLSWRQVNILLDVWNTLPPQYFLLNQLRVMVGTYMGLKDKELKLEFGNNGDAEKSVRRVPSSLEFESQLASMGIPIYQVSGRL